MFLLRNVCLSTLERRGVLHPLSMGRTPSTLDLGGGRREVYPIFPAIQVRGTLPPPCWQDGVLPRLGQGPGLGGGYPKLEQHRVHFLRSERYASCVHAGGLSCLFIFIVLSMGA